MSSDSAVYVTWTNTRKRGSRRRELNHADGFTLVELLAVLVILAAVSISASPVLSGLTETRRSAAASQVVRDLSAARQRAVSCGLRAWVVFRPAEDRYSLLTETVDAPGRTHRVAIKDPSTGRPFVVDLNSGMFAGSGLEAVEIGGGQEVGFDFLGRPLTADEELLQTPGAITLAGDHVVRIEPRTGHCYREP